jgi:hypothetical protein
MANFTIRLKNIKSMRFTADARVGQPYVIECDDLDLSVEMAQFMGPRKVLKAVGTGDRRRNVTFDAQVRDLDDKIHSTTVKTKK